MDSKGRGRQSCLIDFKLYHLNIVHFYRGLADAFLWKMPFDFEVDKRYNIIWKLNNAKSTTHVALRA